MRWNRKDWTFYKHEMINAFEESLMNEIALGTVVKDDAWDGVKKGEFNKQKLRF